MPEFRLYQRDGAAAGPCKMDSQGFGDEEVGAPVGAVEVLGVGREDHLGLFPVEDLGEYSDARGPRPGIGGAEFGVDVIKAIGMAWHGEVKAQRAARGFKLP